MFLDEVRLAADAAVEKKVHSDTSEFATQAKAACEESLFRPRLRFTLERRMAKRDHDAAFWSVSQLGLLAGGSIDLGGFAGNCYFTAPLLSRMT